MNMNNVDQLKQILENIEIQVQKCKVLLEGGTLRPSESADYSTKASELGKMSSEGKDKIIEGVFDGQKMIGPDGKEYSVPANYISKSKLVEGDILKLSIDEAGSFVYKQIGPVDRERLVGKLIKDETSGEYRVMVEDKTYKVILASVTYFKGSEGDETVILVPKGVESQWAAIENIIKK
ncbi:MAG: hypothetical protein COU22_02130 [Candidatus Komeilibacteria bacterium CG10_big_fil_rev_8_21_14_0_10_41_13]|uniref:50S ribosomal protein L7/L12 n=1 Tax=Candidatus Komeilibacteria bacterium CG10_big_fil_rev_8_21_14_0_10_41_13 TaxID=1974476 RepID=A0A2M6WCD2_9BACT|nr:MAG: hypothetical protein COU22_02130 [Candidatus Komeilibacteria bacterium CG10_big_fil_rev_8_21_14_0_10_41_13]